MRTHCTRPTVIGFCAGLCWAIASSCALAIMPPNAALEFSIDLLAGLPVVVARRLGAPLPLYYSLFFLYSGLTGVAVSRLWGRCRLGRKISVQ